MTIAIIQARYNSTRLPQKSVAEIAGMPMVEHVRHRVKQLAGVDSVVVAWPSPDYAEHDVLRRYYEVACRMRATWILRITADCPLWDPAIGQLVLDRARQTRAEYCSNTRPGVDGMDTEVFTMNTLALAHNQALAAHDREHVTPWMRRIVRCEHVPVRLDAQAIKLSVDTQADLDCVRGIYAHLPRCGSYYDTRLEATLYALSCI